MTTPRRNDYYISTRALGHLYRGITLEDIPKRDNSMQCSHGPLKDVISSTLRPLIEAQVGLVPIGVSSATIRHLFTGMHLSCFYPCHSDLAYLIVYAEELRFISLNHTISNYYTDQLEEEEICIGSILGDFIIHILTSVDFCSYAD